MSRLAVCIYIGLLWATTASAQSFTAEVVAILDGDTIDVIDPDNRNDGTIRVRLYGIDAPESRQPYGQRARQYLSRLVFNAEVTVEVMSTDRYGRSIGRVYAGGEDVNLLMVEAGLAWWYARYAADDLDLAEVQEDAQLAGIGLWADARPIPPWDWRRGLRAYTNTEEVSPVPSLDPTPQPRSKACCRVCKKGKPCGDGCIAKNKTCRKEPGCAC